MNPNSKSRTSLFLMELIIAILFFSLASAICLRMFVSSHVLSEKDRNLNNALLWSQNLSEAFSGHKGNINAVKGLFEDSYLITSDDEGEGTLVLFFNEKWEQTDSSLTDASYEAILSVSRDTAQNVYADVNKYNVPLKGYAMVGRIAVLNLKGATDVYSEIPGNDEITIFSNTIDTYIGEN